MAKFAMMEEELAKKDTDHKEHLYTLEKKAVMDKDRLVPQGYQISSDWFQIGQICDFLNIRCHYILAW